MLALAHRLATFFLLQPKTVSDTSRIHFIHLLPVGMEKNIFLSLKIPTRSQEVSQVYSIITYTIRASL